MVAITATNSATPSLQANLGQAKLAQAQSEVTAAEAKVRQLRAQTNDAEGQLLERKSNVARVAASGRIDQNNTYGPRPVRASEVPVKVQNFIESLYLATNLKRANENNALKTNPDAPPVINPQGQATGRILNIAA